MESQTDARIEAAASRREIIDAEREGFAAAEILTWEAKEAHAEEAKKLWIDSARERAHASLEDVAQGHARAQARDAVRESAIQREYQDHQLKNALAVDRKADGIELIKEKQHVLQVGKGVSQETIVADE